MQLSRIIFFTILFIFSCEELIKTQSEDCAGVEDGNAVLDNCGVCDTDSTNDCLQDCASEWGGENICGCNNNTACNYNEAATFNNGSCLWADCNGGCTCSNHEDTNSCEVKEDCAGECDGSFQEDCSGVCAGSAVFDNCDICVGGDTGKIACIQDCALNWGGNQIDNNGDGTCDAVFDIDMTIYQTVQIAEQLWISENLKVTHYNNGDGIPMGYSDDNWTNQIDGAYTIYPVSSSADTYGNLYNWYVVDDERGVCPAGWHIPSDAEWMELEMYLGMSETVVNDIGHRGTDEGSQLAGNADFWDNYDLENNSKFGTSGFTALPSGYFSLEGFRGLGSISYFWSSTADIYNTQARSRYLDSYSASVSRVNSSKSSYCSIRCIRN